jgi:RNA polymerase sigma-70 factor (ECF subfamily)
MSTTDAVLIERWAAERDPEAFRELVNRYAELVYSAARRVLGNSADAEDVAQECFVKLCRLREPTRNLPAWLHRVATRGAMMARSMAVFAQCGQASRPSASWVS